MLSKEQLVDELYENTVKMSDDHIHTHLYEFNGECLYGYECESYGKKGESIYFRIKDKIIQTHSLYKDDKFPISKEDLLKWINANQ